MFFKKSEVVFDDSAFKLFQSEKQAHIFEFDNRYQYDEINLDERPESYFKLYLRSDPTQVVYHRSVGSMLEFLGDMGGLIEIVFLFMGGIIFLIIDRNFKAELIRDTYKVQKYSRDQSEFYRSKKARESKVKHVITSESDSSQSLSSNSSSDNSPKSKVEQLVA